MGWSGFRSWDDWMGTVREDRKRRYSNRMTDNFVGTATIVKLLMASVLVGPIKAHIFVHKTFSFPLTETMERS